jgi:hypothetical protein
MTDAGGESPGRGRFWFAILIWWSMAYKPSIRGMERLDSVANLMGDPRNVSISKGRRAWKSRYIVLGASDAVIFSIVFSRKSPGKLQPCARASSKSSSIMPVTNWRTPTFSSSWVGLGVSNATLAGWNAIGLWRSLARELDLWGLSFKRSGRGTHPIIRSNCSCRIFCDT